MIVENFYVITQTRTFGTDYTPDPCISMNKAPRPIMLMVVL